MLLLKIRRYHRLYALSLQSLPSVEAMSLLLLLGGEVMER